jgi:hypothetical protein
MTHYLLSVHGPAEMSEFGSYDSKEEMEEAFAATEVFNEMLRLDGYRVFGGGLAAASTASPELRAAGVGELQHRRRGPCLRPGLLASAQIDPIEQGVSPRNHASNLRRSDLELVS